MTAVFLTETLRATRSDVAGRLAPAGSRRVLIASGSPRGYTFVIWLKGSKSLD